MFLRSLGLLSAALLLALSTYAVAADSARSADAILAEIEAVKMPTLDPAKRSDQAYVREYTAARQKALQQQADLALELFKSYPDHPQVPALMSSRWNTLTMSGSIDKVLAETEPLAAGSSKLAGNAAYALASATIRKLKGQYAPSIKAVEAFEAKLPGDERAANLLSTLASFMRGAAQEVEVYRRLAEKYPTSKAAGYARGKIRQFNSVGKPFELSFKEAVTGKAMDMKDLKGKVVVVDFWATWCGPCKAEMPKMKQLYADYKPKGVEFIGVSLDQPEDQGGLTKLKNYVAKNEIGWPQHYQGNGWDSEFSISWGVNSIPCVFVVDQDGNLYSNNAGDKLEEMIPELLKKNADKK